MREIAIVDSKRRLLLPKDVIERYGQRFVVVRLPGEMLLKPLPEEPLKALQEEGRKLKGISAEQLEKEVEEYARERV